MRAKAAKSGAGRASSTPSQAAKVAPAASWRVAAVKLAAPPASNPVHAFNAAVRQMKQAQRMVRQTEAILRKAEAATARSTNIQPTRPLHSSRAQLWRWYERRGLSWARFVADHGNG